MKEIVLADGNGTLLYLLINIASKHLLPIYALRHPVLPVRYCRYCERDRMYSCRRDVLDNAGHFVSELMPLYAICSTIVVLTVCTIIDNLRITLLKKPLFKFFYNKIRGFIEKVKGV